MAGPIGKLFRTYPVTLWLTVGVFSYAWKASLVASTYQVQYKQWTEERNKELAELKWTMMIRIEGAFVNEIDHPLVHLLLFKH